MNKGAPPGLEARVKELVVEGRSYIAPKARAWRDEGKKTFGEFVPEQGAPASDDGLEVPKEGACP
ncbi:MAG: hypothetical protein BJ554DRAFT_246 [Olpidium bornovanus]|uniref:Uncharacterized protein n=1 Tax=Olpidium bornovanus TaxID=278681 RepID=A0A8H7ZTV3_9FUNG|nr:MAG: hypothetical protein BJ554DRAFT_246 [Olpidium bornovanus]